MGSPQALPHTVALLDHCYILGAYQSAVSLTALPLMVRFVSDPDNYVSQPYKCVHSASLHKLVFLFKYLVDFIIYLFGSYFNL